MEDPITAAEDTIDDVIDTVEEVFSPKPGGMIDRHRQEKARRAAAQREAENAAERVEENASFAVKVTPVSPEIVASQTITIAAGGTAQILPLNKYRYRSTVMGIKGSGTGNVVLARDTGAALGGSGFTLPPSIPLVVHSRGQLYAYNPDQINTVQVSVLMEIYAPEQ